MLTVEEILKRMIKSIDIFEGISDEEALELAQKFKLNFYPKGSLIIREGTNPDKIYILKNWLLEARKAHWLSSIVLGEIKPGEIFWEMSYFKNQPTVASVVAKQDSDVWEIPRDVFTKFLEKYPKIKEKALQIMEKREEINKEKLRFKLDSDEDIYVII